MEDHHNQSKSPFRNGITVSDIQENGRYETRVKGYESRGLEKRESSLFKRGSSVSKMRSQQELVDELENETSASRWKQCLMVLKVCSSESSIPGVPNFVNSSGKFFPKYWLLVNFASWAGFIIVLYFLSSKFAKYPTSVVVDIGYNASTQFPAVSICNMNRARSDRLTSRNYYRSLPTLPHVVQSNLLRMRKTRLGIDFTISQSECNETGIFWCTDAKGCIASQDVCDGVVDCFDSSDETGCPAITPPSNASFDTLTGSENGILNFDLYNMINWSDPDWFDAYSLSQYEDLRDLYDFTLMSRSLVSATGIDIDEMMRSCSFDKLPCSTKDFFRFEHARYGNCFTFNAPVDSSGNFNKSSIRQTGRTGPDYGLKLTLFIDSEQYLGLLGQKTGVRVVVHSPIMEPDLISNSLIASAGFETEISLTKKEITRLSSPYSNCISAFPSMLPISSSKNSYKYNRQVCQNYCYQYYLKKNCDCYDDYIVEVDTLCDFKNSSIAMCKALVDTMFVEGQLSCGCEQECDYEGFDKITSSISWPSDAYLPFFVSSSWQGAIDDNATSVISFWDNQMTENDPVDYDSLSAEVRRNFLRLSIHFETLNYNTVTFQAAYPYYQYIADIGGYSGLFTGVCVMTLFEVIENILKISFVFCPSAAD